MSGPSFDLCYARRNPPAIMEKGVKLSNESKVPVEIYPNPTKSYFVIRLPQTAARLPLKIFDAAGKMIRLVNNVTSAQEHKKEMRISLKGMNPGIYFLQVGSTVQKFLVVK
jgi:hypothetical protein